MVGQPHGQVPVTSAAPACRRNDSAPGTTPASSADSTVRSTTDSARLDPLAISEA